MKSSILVLGTISCGIASNTLTCSASGGSVTIPAGEYFTVTFAAQPSATGTFTNPTGGICKAYPGEGQSSQTNNTCNSDTVTVTAPDLTVSKSDNVGGSTAPGTSWTWTLKVSNANGTYASAAMFASPSDTILTDNLPSGLTYGSPMQPPSGRSGITGTIDCSISSDILNCAPSSSVGIAPGGYFTVTFTATPPASATGTFTNPNGTCSVDPGNAVTESNESNNNCNSDSVVLSALSSIAPEAGTGGTFQVGYVTHLDVGDSFINITNDGQSQPPSYGIGTSGGTNLCVGVYTFDQNEELMSCCSCLVTPNGLVGLSARAINLTNLTGEQPTSLVVKLLAWSTTAGASSTAQLRERPRLRPAPHVMQPLQELW